MGVIVLVTWTHGCFLSTAKPHIGFQNFKYFGHFGTSLTQSGLCRYVWYVKHADRYCRLNDNCQHQMSEDDMKYIRVYHQCIRI